MLKRLFMAVTCAAIALCATPVLADGNVNFSLGQRSLNESDLEPVDEQPFVGVTADFKMEDWPIDLAGGLYRSTKEESVGSLDVRATITELSFGVMKTWNVSGNMHPFAGGGLALVNVEAEVGSPFGSVDDDDNSTALYAEGGVYWRVGSMLNLGVHGRFNKASDVSVGGGEIDSDYFQVGVLAGFGWGAK